MKILSSEQSRAADAYTIQHQNIASIDLMERAALRCVEALLLRYSGTSHFHIFCGMGNNGGDGLAIARMLAGKGYKLSVYLVQFKNNLSSDAETNTARLHSLGIPVTKLSSAHDLPLLADGVILDAIFGSGLTRSVTGIAASVIRDINSAELPVVSIDIPSGLFGEDNTNNDTTGIVNADLTLCIQSPKLAVLLPENSKHSKAITIVDIGLDEDFIRGLNCSYFYCTPQWMQTLFQPKNKFDHKGKNGHPMIIAGKEGMMGAALLSAEACLRSGAGLVTLHSPGCGYEIIQTRLPEVIVSKNAGEHFLEAPLPPLSPVTAVGPGIGLEAQTGKFLKLLLQHANQPLVLDADALNWLSENKDWLNFLPTNSILTPHPKEFERITQPWSNAMEKLDLLVAFATKYRCIVVLKGAHTAIANPKGEIFFNSTGNPGMATAGSGDVLTGVITALVAQGYTALNAAILGVYLHGLAGDLAAEENGYEALIASDIINHLGAAFTSLYPEP